MGNFLIVLGSIFIYVSLSVGVEGQIEYVNRGCVDTGSNYNKSSKFDTNLNRVLSTLTEKSSSVVFYNSTAGDAGDKVYGLFQCRYDLSLDICTQCVKNATKKIIEECPSYGEGIVWYLQCSLRYANRNIFNLYETSVSVTNPSLTNVLNSKEFTPMLWNTLNAVVENASSTKFHFSSQKTINLTTGIQLYSFAQCTEDIDAFGCESCLKNAITDIFGCCSEKTWVMVFFPSCQLRYDTNGSFLNDTSTNMVDSGNKKSSSKSLLIAAIVVCITIALIVLAVILWICLCYRKLKKSTSNVPLVSARVIYDDIANGDVESVGDKGFVQYDFATLKAATTDFSNENALGEGTFGVVYKGRLTNGKQLAIRRFPSTFAVGAIEFMTNARLLSKLQHSNLVRFIGFCSEDDNRLLVHEFMPNGSIDRLMFDPKKRPLLDWVTRHKIIKGIAKGLEYLECLSEDPTLDIDYCKLQSNNILLDKEMNPKIADFGLAKFYESETTQPISGPREYIAPDIVTQGNFSEKCDTYSFGIIVLEIVTGQKNRVIFRSPQTEDLPLHAWRLWNEDRTFDLTDPALHSNCSSNEVVRCIQIGLLCVQADVDERPTMIQVVQMLNSSTDLPFPTSPAMYAHQFSIASSESYNGDREDDPTKTVTWRTELDEDLYPVPI